MKRSPSNRPQRSGVVLVAVLIVTVLLSLAAYQYSELMTAEYRASDSAVRSAQVRALATSGVHYAAAVLADKDTVTNRLNKNIYDNSEAFRGLLVNPSNVPRFQGRFSLMAPPPVDDAIGGGGQSRFGVSDESGKINLNALVALDPTGKIAHDVLVKLPNMTEEIADAIIDWIDADDEQRPSGAENQYYSALSPGYRCKNGPLDSLEELLLVRGITPQLLFGTDKNRNGRQDASDDDMGAGFDPGWSAYLTVYSRELNRDADNQERIYLNDQDTNSLYTKLTTALGDELANWVMACRLYGVTPSTGTTPAGALPASQLTKSSLGDMTRRGQSISSIFALVDGTVSIPQSGGGGGGAVTATIAISATGSGGNAMIVQSVTTTAPQTGSSSGRGSGNSSGAGSTPGGSGGGGANARVYTSPLSDPAKRKQYLPILLDKCTTRKDAEIPSRININTAPKAVVTCLPGLEEADVQQILSARPALGSAEASDEIYQTPAWLLTEAQLSTAKLRALERYITGRSQTYRLQSLGYFDQGGPVARVEAVVDTNGGSPRILYFRDLSELGRGFDVPR